MILRVYDLPPDTGAVSLTLLEDHASDCIVQVFVDDKLKPVCLAPLNQTIACELLTRTSRILVCLPLPITAAWTLF
ncbi:MAG: hypothetical protein H6574_17345 [Lewinellaceae bacterium]|nr:hypothetical protein [Lewinellaceae bacterium]